MMDADVRKLIRGLRESARTFEKYETNMLIPVLDGFIKRHIREIRMAADQLAHEIGEE